MPAARWLSAPGSVFWVHRAHIVAHPMALTGTPTSARGACPQPPRGCEQLSGDKCVSSPFGSWRKALFLCSGFCCSGFSAASRAAVAVPSGWRQKETRKRKQAQRLGFSNSGKWQVWDLVPVFVGSNCLFIYFFPSLYYGTLLWQDVSLLSHRQCHTTPKLCLQSSAALLATGTVLES